MLENKEKMIPLSVIDAKIKEIENDNCYQGSSWDGVRKHFISKIEEIKKEAIPVQGQPLKPLPEKGETISMARAMEMVRHYETTEQRIMDRIAFLEQDNERLKNTNFSSFMNTNDTRIDELRKLLSS